VRLPSNKYRRLDQGSSLFLLVGSVDLNHCRASIVRKLFKVVLQQKGCHYSSGLANTNGSVVGTIGEGEYPFGHWIVIQIQDYRRRFAFNRDFVGLWI